MAAMPIHSTADNANDGYFVLVLVLGIIIAAGAGKTSNISSTMHTTASPAKRKPNNDHTKDNPSSSTPNTTHEASNDQTSTTSSKPH